jgi:hypothetical protein
MVLIAAAGPLAMVSVAQATSIPATPGSGAITRTVTAGGTTVFRPGVPGADVYAPGTELRQSGPSALGRAVVRSTSTPYNRSAARDGAMAAAPAASTASSAITRIGPQLLQSFLGINHRDQRLANNGNQFSTEPPDQGLCVGGGHVVEAVNDALRVYATSSAPQTGVEDLNTFFGYPPAVIRSTHTFGPVVTDPSCLFDPTTHQFFLAALTLGADPATGAFTGQTQLDFAVTANPTGTWAVYHLDVTDDGTNGTPVHAGCPCVGDYPHIGVDSNGFYISTNEYSFFGPEYDGSQIYAFSKRALAAHAHTAFVTQYDTNGADSGKPGFTVWPAQAPVTSQYALGEHGTEFFLSSNAAPEANGTGTSNTIVVWALTHTDTLGTRSPSAVLSSRRVPVRAYSIPPASDQRSGPTPLKDCLNDTACATFLNGVPDPFTPEVTQPLDSNDSRMQQVTLAGGMLYGALDTGTHVGGTTKAGIAYFVVKPSVSKGKVNGVVKTQGGLALAGNNLTYPAIGITAAGKGVLSFTLVGKDYYPSAAFTGFDAQHGAGAIVTAAAGVGPQDGFSGYKYYGGGGPGVARPRWGDYGATAVDGNTIWAAAEYIAQQCTLTQYEGTTSSPFGSCDGTRTALANWATRISQIQP